MDGWTIWTSVWMDHVQYGVNRAGGWTSERVEGWTYEQLDHGPLRGWMDEPVDRWTMDHREGG